MVFELKTGRIARIQARDKYGKTASNLRIYKCQSVLLLQYFRLVLNKYNRRTLVSSFIHNDMLCNVIIHLCLRNVLCAQISKTCLEYQVEISRNFSLVLCQTTLIWLDWHVFLSMILIQNVQVLLFKKSQILQIQILP